MFACAHEYADHVDREYADVICVKPRYSTAQVFCSAPTVTDFEAPNPTAANSCTVRVKLDDAE
jgi:hypothetical protein